MVKVHQCPHDYEELPSTTCQSHIQLGMATGLEWILQEEEKNKQIKIDYRAKAKISILSKVQSQYLIQW